MRLVVNDPVIITVYRFKQYYRFKHQRIGLTTSNNLLFNNC